jgi:monofunctional biosynthetic peptidoglycan transglycosylase
LGTPVAYLLWLPDVPALKTTNPTETTLMQLREKQAHETGKQIRIIYHWKDLHDISPNLMHAVLLSEDDTFYQHHGFDLEQIQVAMKMDWEQKRFVYGGSTITQQLARSLYLSPRKNLLRKAKEALITVLLEKNLPKDRIMEIYLNVIEWGPGVFGAEAASWTYFQKPAKSLTPDEAVALASILPSPRRWSPVSERAFMARRRTRLYARMRNAGFIPPDQSTAPFVPDDIQQMAAQANEFLERQQTEENPLQPPMDDSAAAAGAVTNEEGLVTPEHAPAPQ